MADTTDGQHNDKDKGLDLWNLDTLSPNFNFLDVPDEQYNFMTNGSTLDHPGSTGSLFAPTPPSTSALHAQKKPSPMTAHSPAQKQPAKNEQANNFLVNHYETLLKQNKVSMREAGTSPANSYASPTGPTSIPSPASQQRPPQQSRQEMQQRNHPMCDHCRRRQIKCLMKSGMPQCTHCESKGLKCTYTESPSNPILKRNMGVLQDEGQNKRIRTGPYVPSQAQQAHLQQMRKSQPMLQYPRSSFFVGTSSMFDPSLLDKIRLDKIDQVQLNRSLSLRKVSPTVQFILRDDFTDELALNAERNVDAVENLVAPHGVALINTYFRVIHPSFPILHKKVFLEKYARSYREFSAPLLATVYSLACKWWDFDPSLSQHAKPDIEALNDIALKTFFEVTERPRLSAVQAGLLLLQCRSENPNNWILCQQVVSLAEELGLGLDCHDWKLPKWERGLRRRLAWAVWIQEKWTALIESRVSHFTLGRNWLVRDITNDDFPEPPPALPNINEEEYSKLMSEYEIGKNLFKERIELSMILSEILESFYTYSVQRSVTRIDQVLKLAKPLQLKLRQWYHSLPQNLQMLPVTPDKLSPVACLHLSYFAAEITLHRKIILNLSNEDPPELVKVCRAAATTRLTAVLDFLKNLKKEHINAFWHSFTSANFTIVATFAAILYVTSSSPQEASIYRECANNLKMLLQNLSRFFSPARCAIARMDMLLMQIPGLLKDGATIQPFQQQMPAQQQQPQSQQQNTNGTSPFSMGQSPMSPFFSQQMMNTPQSQSMPNNQPLPSRKPTPQMNAPVTTARRSEPSRSPRDQMVGASPNDQRNSSRNTPH
jgi:ribosomal protein L37AE/L43A